jgi:hypothetical protein
LIYRKENAMIKMKYYNDFGDVVFDKDNWHIIEAEGLSVPAKSISASRYINHPGQCTTYCIENPRTITLSGDINIAESGYEKYSEACCVLAKEGILVVETDLYTRQIGARCIDFVPGERKGNYRCFVMQFLCDVPFFEDTDYSESVIYQRKPLLSKDTVLPAVFSERVSKGDVFYQGTAYAEPEFYVKIPSGVGTISVINNTTGGRLSIGYNNDEFSQLVIDVKNRTITDENGVSRLDYLTDDSFFDGFILQHGKNNLEVINSNVENDIGTKMRYKIRYQEAIV